MGAYIPHTIQDREDMLRVIGRKSARDLFAEIPREALYTGGPALPAGLSELEVARAMQELAAQNTVFKSVFRGAGAYRHYIPAAVKRITANETFLTAYTPYQAEISQGILQSIFEYQTMICELTGMDASNASVYDGASAAAEAVRMCASRDRAIVYVTEGAHPHVIETIRAYCFGYEYTVKTVPLANGTLDSGALKTMLAEEGGRVLCLYLQQPNFFGQIEDLKTTADILHEAGALLIAGCNPIALGILESPGVLGADIAVGEGQPLGLPLGFGGPYLGFMACKAAFMRKLPGRIVGETTDHEGRRAFVLTLQAREQHIRREKALSNVCSNEALCALATAVYLSVMGADGLAEAARQCHAKAVYAAKRIAEIPGFDLRYAGNFFHEFVTACPDVAKTLAALEKEGVLGGLPLSELSPGESGLLWCVTEMNSKADIDALCDILGGIARSLKGGV
ncbi:MAG: aminomethyl-transferring glycine dehydrogenase subunit GcvPA [Treponema sp.]|jgi:glycine dehydrogenase subunit 1|nr:aminomethyl-transferring glycine dehydrogenase subunit GcvPA [Treponema sp.]